MKWLIFRKKWQHFCRYRFIKLFLAALFSIILINHPILAFYYPKPEIRGVWLTTNDTNTMLDQPKLEAAIAQLSRLNFNTLYPVVWNSGYALYPSQIAKKAEIQPFVPKGLQGQDPLTDLISKAHSQELLVLPWFEFGFMAPPTSELALKHPQWITQKRDGSQTTISAAGQVVWLNPFRPEVQQFITSLVLEVMDLYDVDGIQFDDHLSLPSELGYDAYTINLYKQETGKEPPVNHQDKDWLKWRADKLTAYVAKLSQAIKSKKSNAIFSVSPNPYDTAYMGHLQDWLTWVEKDLIDEVIVQVYRPTLESFISQLKRPEIQKVRQKIPTGVGILTGLRNRQIEIEFIEEKVLAAKKYGLGVSFFFYDSLWNYAPESVSERQAKFLALFPYRAERELESPKVPEKIIPENQPEPMDLMENSPSEEKFEPTETTIENLIPIEQFDLNEPIETSRPGEFFEPSEPTKPIENSPSIDTFKTNTPRENDTPNSSFEPTAPLANDSSLDTFKPYKPRENTASPVTSEPTETAEPYPYAEDGIPIPVSW